MSEAIRLESPLVRFGLPRLRGEPLPARAKVIASERAFLGHFNLRGDPGDARFVARCEQVLGVAPPVAANTVNESAQATVYWLGPDEWLVGRARRSHGQRSRRQLRDGARRACARR